MTDWILIIWLSTGHAASVPTVIDVRDEAQCVALAGELRKKADMSIIWARHVCVRRP